MVPDPIAYLLNQENDPFHNRSMCYFLDCTKIEAVLEHKCVWAIFRTAILLCARWRWLLSSAAGETSKYAKTVLKDIDQCLCVCVCTINNQRIAQVAQHIGIVKSPSHFVPSFPISSRVRNPKHNRIQSTLLLYSSRISDPWYPPFTAHCTIDRVVEEIE